MPNRSRLLSSALALRLAVALTFNASAGNVEFAWAISAAVPWFNDGFQTRIVFEGGCFVVCFYLPDCQIRTYDHRCDADSFCNLLCGYGIHAHVVAVRCVALQPFSVALVVRFLLSSSNIL